MKTNWLIIGTGDLGTAIFDHLCGKGINANIISVKDVFKYHLKGPTNIVFTSWITDVDEWEENPEKCSEWFGDIMLDLDAAFCLEPDLKKFIFISSNMAERPVVNGYGFCKLLGEKILLKMFGKKLRVIRTQYLYGGEKKYAYPTAAIDMYIRPVQVDDFARALIGNVNKLTPLSVMYGHSISMYDFVKSTDNPMVKACKFADLNFKSNRKQFN